jgi:predicted N-acyltransferase
VLVKDLETVGADHARVLEHFSYNELATDPNMILALDPAWKTFDDYLASLQSKYRKNALKVRRDLEAAGCRIETLTDLSRHAARLHELYLQVHEAAAVRPVTVSSGYIPALAEAAGEGFRCTAVRRGEEILGFVTTMREDRNTAIGYYIGFDRSLKQEIPVYFALLQAVVADALSLGCKRVSFGRTALEPKAKLGARPVATKIWIRHANPVMNVFVKSLLGAVPHDEAPDRNPFKGSPESD